VVLVAALSVTWFVFEQDTVAVPGLVSSRPAGPAQGPPTGEQDDPGPVDPSWTADDEAPRTGAAVTPVTPVTELDARPVTAPPRLWLHVASFRDASRADRMVSMLTEVGAPARQRPVTLADGGSWVRVLVGPFDDRTVAEAMADRLQTQGLITFHRQIEE